MSPGLPEKVIRQMIRAGLPIGGQHPFVPRLKTNRRGEQVIDKRSPTAEPKKDKKGYVDDQGRIWIKDDAHGGLPEHWDVQINDGADYVRVDQNGNELV